APGDGLQRRDLDAAARGDRALERAAHRHALARRQGQTPAARLAGMACAQAHARPARRLVQELTALLTSHRAFPGAANSLWFGRYLGILRHEFVGRISEAPVFTGASVIRQPRERTARPLRLGRAGDMVVTAGNEGRKTVFAYKLTGIVEFAVRSH